MICLKCGRETDQTFCEHCRKLMEKYPVKPGSIVLLPKKTRTAKRTPQRRDPVAPEIRIQKLRRVIRRMGVAIAALAVLLASMGFAIYRLLAAQEQRPVGQNYSTVTKPTETEASTEST